jgi:hypothetical protein
VNKKPNYDLARNCSDREAQVTHAHILNLPASSPFLLRLKFY